MGLDMYLSAKKHVAGYSFYGEENAAIYDRMIKALEVEEYVDPDTPTAEISLTVGYWRKANQIHNWFVRNVQGGEDKCEEHYVNREGSFRNHLEFRASKRCCSNGSG